MNTKSNSAKKYLYPFLALVAIFLFAAFYWVQAGTDKKVILIVTKDQADTSSLNPTRMQVAATLALQDYLRMGENPLQIEHKYITYTGDEEEGYFKAKAYLEKNNKVVALVGDFNSSGTEYMARLAEEHQLPHLSFFATGEEIFVGRPWSFSYRPRIKHETETMLGLLVDHLEAKEVIILATEQQNLLPRAEEFREISGDRGVEIVEYHTFSQEEKDFRSIIEGFSTHSSTFDALVLFFNSHQLEHFLQQRALAGLETPVLTTGVIIHPELIPVFQGVDHSLYTILPRLFFHLNNDAQLRFFLERYMVEAGFHRIDSLGPWIYDGFWTLHETLEHTNNRQELKEALQVYDNVRFLGCVCFDQEGLLEKNLFVPVRINSGGFEEVYVP